MGEVDRYQEFKEHYQREKPLFETFNFQNGPYAITILFIFFFIFILTANVFYMYTNQGQGMEALHYTSASWFTLPHGWLALAKKPWTLFTFMFVHSGKNVFYVIFNFLANLIWLYVFAAYLKAKLGSHKQVFPLFYMGSLAAAICFVSLGQNSGGNFEGPVAGLATLAGFITVLMPMERTIKLRIPAFLLVTFFMLLAFYTSLYGKNYSIAIAYVVAFALGMYLAILFKKGNDVTAPIHRQYQKVLRLFSFNSKSSIRDQIFYNTEGRPPFSKRPIVTEERLNAILEKISAQGMESLNQEEKDFLRKASN